MATDRFAFSRSVELANHSVAFRRDGRVLIPSVLETASADALHNCLATQVPWRLAYNEGERAVVIGHDEFKRMGAAGVGALMQQVMTRARKEFQYVYHTYPMLSAYLNREDPGLLLHEFLEWLNLPETLEVVRRITEIQTLIKADAQATLYRPGQFLTRHDDDGGNKEKRRVAYVLNLTPRWNADWGGMLQFLDTDGRVRESWMPGYNMLALFRVPVPHLVSFVAPFAEQPRYAITGWFRDG
jgi:Rps23 Pro-64 3,4-dihydroxylase Tpa1-like proline 4-hydroxylase